MMLLPFLDDCDFDKLFILPVVYFLFLCDNKSLKNTTVSNIAVFCLPRKRSRTIEYIRTIYTKHTYNAWYNLSKEKAISSFLFSLLAENQNLSFSIIFSDSQ